MKKIINNFIKDVQKELDDEFDRSFEDKGFFGQKWPVRKLDNNKGSLMTVKSQGGLRDSISSSIKRNNIVWSSSVPYASIHNQGGEITVSAQMKKFFWAMYYKTSGASGRGPVARRQRMSTEAAQWKAMALKKVGSKIKIPQRQFIGDHPQVRKSIEKVFKEDTIPEIEVYITSQFKQK